MGKKTFAKFEWNESRSVIIRDKGFTPEYYHEIGEIMRRHMHKYVPYGTEPKGTHLADSAYVRVVNNGANIIYPKPYANRQYMGVKQGGESYDYNKQLHPLATSLWDQVCWQNEKFVIGKEINEARRKYSRD